MTQVQESKKEEVKKFVFKPRYFIKSKRRLSLLHVARSQADVNKLEAEQLEEVHLSASEIERLRHLSGDLCLEDILDEYAKKVPGAR
jgi:hypothetical protein